MKEKASTTRVMIVDDAERTRKAVASLLRFAGYETICAANGQEALDTAQKTRPDLMLLDLDMPGIDGFGVLESLHDDPSLRSLPVILLTGDDKVESRERARNLGARECLIKSRYSLEEMFAQINAHAPAT